MKCPYCAEEINDSAIVCRFCDRDFYLLAPILQRLAAVENQLQEHVQALGTLTNEVSRPQEQGVRKSGSQIISRIWMVAVASGGSLGSWWLSKDSPSRAGLILAIIWPFVVGLGSGFWLRGGHAKMHLVVGIIVGTVDFIGITLMLIAEDGMFPRLYLDEVSIVLLGPAALFALGGILADWVEKRYFPERYQFGFATRLAVSLSNITGNRGSPRNVEMWKGIVSVMTPILSIVSSIIVAYFTYLAAVAKK